MDDEQRLHLRDEIIDVLFSLTDSELDKLHTQLTDKKTPIQVIHNVRSDQRISVIVLIRRIYPTISLFEAKEFVEGNRMLYLTDSEAEVVKRIIKIGGGTTDQDD